MAASEESTALVKFVERALYSLNFCAVDATSHLQQWFVLAFNQWYIPLLGRGRDRPFAALFDFGMHLVAPGIGLTGLPPGPNMVEGRFRRYKDFLRSLEDRPLMHRARSILAAAAESDRPRARQEVGWLLVDALVGDLSAGCPSRDQFKAIDSNEGEEWEAAELEHVRECPRCAKIESDRSAGKSGWLEQRDDPPQPFPLPLVGLKQGRIVVRLGATVLEELELQIPPFDESKPHPAFWLPEDLERADVPNRVGLFMARFACDTEHVEDLLDRPVIEACMSGVDIDVGGHRPPPLANPVLERRNKSKLPGSTGGVTRYEAKTDLDSLLDVVPSELALLLQNELAGLQKLLEKPLIIKHEREQDRVPKHRALVCFLVESDEEHEADQQRSRNGDVEPSHVYAKRQAFDVIRDLREAVQKLKNRAHIEIDVAVFVLSAYDVDAGVHRLFRLDQLASRVSADDRLDRFDQMISFGGLVPGFFSHVGIADTSAYDVGDTGSYEIVDPQVDRFLRRYPQRVAPYHANYIVAIGSVDRLMEFVPAAIRDARRVANIRNRVMLIAVDPDQIGSSAGLANEPMWSCVTTRTLHEAAQALGDNLPEMSLAELRAEFLAMVLGAPEGHRRLGRLLQYRSFEGAEENHDA